MWHQLLFWLGIACILFVYVRFALPGFRKLGGGPVDPKQGGADAKTDTRTR